MLQILSGISQQQCSFTWVCQFYINVIATGIVQNMKPVQNCTGFIFCTFHAVIQMTIY